MTSTNRFEFAGHTVTSIGQGVTAVLSHHIEPLIGQIRLADADHQPAPDPAPVYAAAAQAILAALAAHAEETTQSLDAVAALYAAPDEPGICGRLAHPSWPHDCTLTDRVQARYTD